MNAVKGIGGPDDTAIPSSIRRLGKGQEPETIATLVERDLRERGLPRHVMCRWLRERRPEGEKKGKLIVDGEGFPVLKGFTPFVPRKKRDEQPGDGASLRPYGQRQRRSFGGEPIRTIASARDALAEMEDQAGIPVVQAGSLITGSSRQRAVVKQMSAPIGGAARVFGDEERTMGVLTARMARLLPVCVTSVEIIQRFRRMQRRVFTAETRYDHLDRKAWQQAYEKTRTLCVLRRGEPQLGLVVSLKTSNAYWDAVVRAMDFAVDEESLDHNLARGVKRRRPRKQWVVRGRAKPLDVCQVRDVELVVMRIAEAARRAVAEGRVPPVHVPFGLPRARGFTQIDESITLTGGRAAKVTFGVVEAGGVPIVQIGGANRRYFANGLEAMILTLYRAAPRASELLALRRGSLDLAGREVRWEWRRHWADGHAELAGRRLADIEYGVKNSVDGDPVTRDQRLSDGVVAAMGRWLADLETLRSLGFGRSIGVEGLVFPSMRGQAFPVRGFENLLYAIQDVAGVPQSWPHRARHGLHALHSLLQIDVADTAEQLGQTVETAMRHYRLATGRGKRLAVERGEAARRALDEGCTEDEIRARYASGEARGWAGSGQEFGPQVIDGGLAS
jgi:hypothetical protein